MKNKILLSQIFAAADAEKANAAPGAEDWTPSESFTRRVSALARGKRVRTRRLFDTAGRRAVAALFAVIIIVTAAMCVKAIREPVLELFANVFDTHTKFETSAAESSPPRELEVNNKASSAALTSYLSFEDSLRWATDYIEGRYISCEIKNHICYCTFEVIKDIRGNGLSGTVEVQYMPFDNIRLNDIDALYNDVPFSSLMTYLIPLCRYTDVYDENDIFSFAGDDLIIPSLNYKKNATLQGTELREHIKTQDALEAFENGSLKEYILDSIKDNPRCLGAPYTESTNIKDIIAFSDHVIKVRVEEPHSNFFDVNRISCTCVVEDVLKGDLETNSEVMVVFPEGKVEQEKSYIIAVCENGSPSFLVMSSKNSVFDCSQYNSIKDLITNEVYTYTFLHADWPYYQTVDEIIDASSYIFIGTVTDISFEIVDYMTGKADRDPDSQSTDRSIETVYTIDINKTYKGGERSTTKLCADGGIRGYKEKEQNALLRSAGLIGQDSDYIIICDSVGITPEIGCEYLFCTYRGIGDFDFIINPTQFAFPLDSDNAKNLIDMLE